MFGFVTKAKHEAETRRLEDEADELRFMVKSLQDHVTKRDAEIDHLRPLANKWTAHVAQATKNLKQNKQATAWQWWATPRAAYHEGEWTLGEFSTREEAVAAGMEATEHGEFFYVVEARSSTAKKHEGAEIVPFVATRNLEIIEHIAAGSEAAA